MITMFIVGFIACFQYKQGATTSHRLFTYKSLKDTKIQVEVVGI